MTELLPIVVKVMSDLILKDIRIYDFKDVSPYYDYQVIASATNERQVGASIHRLIDALPKDVPFKIEGKSENRWILFDLGNIIVHVMHQETREYYQIEKLFVERKQLSMEGVLGEL
ncbi:MAG: ribosome silencing factor [Candidatus Izemoplasmatales bacterium]|jgi:ribosome-associated protein|nr:ribosome silencing factor [Candidatus Izemoplasmatales bacterium]